MATTIQGLPIIGFDHLEPGTHQIPYLSWRNAVYCPGYVRVVEDPDHEGDTKIVAVGIQPHIMTEV